MLTSMMKRVDNAVFLTIEAAVERRVRRRREHGLRSGRGWRRACAVPRLRVEGPAVDQGRGREGDDDIIDGMVIVPDALRSDRAGSACSGSRGLRYTRGATCTAGRPSRFSSGSWLRSRGMLMPVLELRDVTKMFPGVVANDRVSPHARAAARSWRFWGERRRQVHDHERGLRTAHRRRRRDPGRRPAGDPDQVAETGDRPRHRHGPPALHAGRAAHGDREHRARDGSRGGSA